MNLTWLSVTIALLFASIISKPTATYRYHGPAVLNDLSVTPGKVRTTNAKEVCYGGSTSQYRHTTEKEKNQVYEWYGAKKKPGICCEVDHLVSLELGGADEVENLWPEPYSPKPGAHEKDLVENWLHKEVCAGRMPLTQAQAKISQDWYAVFLMMHERAQAASYWAEVVDGH